MVCCTLALAVMGLLGGLTSRLGRRRAGATPTMPPAATYAVRIER